MSVATVSSRIAVRTQPLAVTGNGIASTTNTTATGHSGVSSFETNSVGRPAHTRPTGVRLQKLIRQTFQNDLAAWNQRALAHGGREITLASGTKRVLAPVPKPSGWSRNVGDRPMLSHYEKGGPKYPLRDAPSTRPTPGPTPTGPQRYTLEWTHQKITSLKGEFLDGKVRQSSLGTLVKRAFEGVIRAHDPGYDALSEKLNALKRTVKSAGVSQSAVLAAMDEVMRWRP